jgi:hypothetical protein
MSKDKTPTPVDAREKIDNDARQAQAAVDAARGKLEAGRAEAQRLVGVVLPLDATDAAINELVRSRG